jgi:hypothetical protein
MEIDQAVPGKLPEPRIEGDGRLAGVGRQLASRLGQDFLDHVGRIDAATQLRIHADGDHSREASSVPVEELPHGGLVATGSPVNEFGSIGLRCQDIGPYY